MPCISRERMIDKDLVCLLCGNVHTIWRNDQPKSRRPEGHPKPLYCESCGVRTYHVELSGYESSEGFGLRLRRNKLAVLSSVTERSLKHLLQTRRKGTRACFIRIHRRDFIAIIDFCYPNNPFVAEVFISISPLEKTVADKLMRSRCISGRIHLVNANSLEGHHHTFKIVRDRATVLNDTQVLNIRQYIPQIA